MYPYPHVESVSPFWSMLRFVKCVGRNTRIRGRLAPFHYIAITLKQSNCAFGLFWCFLLYRERRRFYRETSTLRESSTSATALFSSHPQQHRGCQSLPQFFFHSGCVSFVCAFICMCLFFAFDALAARCSPISTRLFFPYFIGCLVGIVVDSTFNTFVHRFITFQTSISFRKKRKKMKMCNDATIFLPQIRCLKRKTLLLPHGRLRHSATFVRHTPSFFG